MTGENKVLIVEEILVKNGVFQKPEISNFNLLIHRDCYILAQKNIKKAMIEFAKLHVEAALEVAANNSVKLSSTKDTVKNSYNLENIK